MHNTNLIDTNSFQQQLKESAKRYKEFSSQNISEARAHKVESHGMPVLNTSANMRDNPSTPSGEKHGQFSFETSVAYQMHFQDDFTPSNC